jgi:tetratricopeptide (TPR) repeat protein
VSRLADILMRMDEKRALRPGLGGIPHLGESAEPQRQWRIVGTLVIVVSMGALTLALLLRPQVATPPAAKPPVMVGVPEPARLVAVPVTPSRERVAALKQGGLAAARNGEIEAAATAFRQASDLDPTDAEAWTNLGVVLIRSGDDARGVEALRRALRVVPGYLEAHRNLAVALDRQGRGVEAARHYRAFLAGTAADNPDRAMIVARLAEMGAGRAAE